MFVPSYGFENQKNGMIQLLNKKIGNPLVSDLQFIKPYQKLIGMLIQNVVDSNRIIDISINLKKNLIKIRRKHWPLQKCRFIFCFINRKHKIINGKSEENIKRK